MSSKFLWVFPTTMKVLENFAKTIEGWLALV